MQPGISSLGRPVSIPADITLLAGFFTELFQKLIQALTENAASKPRILLHGVRKLGSDIFQFHAQLGEELKGVRAELSGSVKENQRLRRGIYSKCLNKLF